MISNTDIGADFTVPDLPTVCLAQYFILKRRYLNHVAKCLTRRDLVGHPDSHGEAIDEENLRLLRVV